MFWSTLKAMIHSFASAVGAALKVAKQGVVAGLKPGTIRAAQAALFGIGCAALAPGALANRLIICWNRGSDPGCRTPTLFRTADAKAGVGTVVGRTLGRTKRNPSVSKKKKVLFLIIGPPTEPAHWLALENGRGVNGTESLFIQLFEFMVRPFHQYWALPWNLLLPDLVT